jgi:hypothetical protein
MFAMMIREQGIPADDATGRHRSVEGLQCSKGSTLSDDWRGDRIHENVSRDVPGSGAD